MSRAGNIQKKDKKKRKIELDYVRIILVAFTIYFAYTFITQQFSLNEYDVRIADIETKITASNDRVEEINELKSKTNTIEFIEEIARSELGLIKPYEKVFIDVNK